MPNINPNSTNYVHSHEPNTNDLVQAMAYNPYGEPVLRIDDTTVQHTSKNRRKVSTNQIVFFNSFQYTKDPQIWDEAATGTASAELDTVKGVELSVGGSAGDEVIRQTRNVIEYIPGRQNEITQVVRFTEPEEGIRRRVGLFNENNGFFFENWGLEYAVCIRKTDESGTTTDTRITRENWNIDKLDGTGPSGIVADPSAIQMLDIEYEWYGAGIVEFKWIINNNAYPIHVFYHGNRETEPFINTPFLPVRLELTNVDGTPGTHYFYQSSTSVQAEGARGPIGREENVSTPFAGVSTGGARVLRPVLSIRLRSDRLQGVALPLEFLAASLDNTPLYYQIRRDVTLTGADWQNVPGNSFCEYDYAATDYTGGEAIQTGYISATNQGITNAFPKETILQLGRNDLGTTAQIFTVLCATAQSNKDVFASLSWVEVR